MTYEWFNRAPDGYTPLAVNFAGLDDRDLHDLISLAVTFLTAHPLTPSPLTRRAAADIEALRVEVARRHHH